MLLAELNVRHTRRHMPTRRVALDHAYLPTSGPAHGATLIAAVVAAVKHSLKADGINSEMTEAIWSQAGALRVKRMEPVLSARGKLMPLHLLRRSETSSE